MGSVVRRISGLLGFLIALAAIAGCSRGPEFAPVEGVVTINGRPMNDAEVVFMPDPGAGTVGPTSAGYTDEKGHYSLATSKGQLGAIVGTHRVCIRDLTTLPPPPILDAEGNRQRAARPANPGPKGPRMPGAYSSSHATPLRDIEVKPGPQTLDFPIGGDKKK